MTLPRIGRRGVAPARVLVLLLFLGIATLAGALFALSRMRDGGSEADLGRVPAFTLTDHRGGSLSDQDLLGRVWMVDFFFTRCRGICPTLTDRMLDLQSELTGREGWQLVSVTVDPEFDTPEVLSAYAEEKGADADRWTFLTGEKAYVYDVIRNGFLLSVRANPSEEEPILHSPRIVLVDQAGEIRGLYDVFEVDDMERLLDDAVRLIEHPPS